MDYTELSSLANSDMENDHSVKCEQSSGYSSSAPSKSPEVLRHISSSPSPFTFLSNIKEENNDTSSPLISDNDPMFCIPHKWDVDDDYM
ncbi:Transmembrane epididymal protein [Dirofilaria immitis]